MIKKPVYILYTVGQNNLKCVCLFYTAILVIRSLGFIIDHSFFLILLIKLFSGMGTHFWSRNYTRTTVLNEIINCQEKVKNVYSLNTCSIVNNIIPFFQKYSFKKEKISTNLLNHSYSVLGFFCLASSPGVQNTGATVIH